MSHNDDWYFKAVSLRLSYTGLQRERGIAVVNERAIPRYLELMYLNGYHMICEIPMFRLPGSKTLLLDALARFKSHRSSSHLLACVNEDSTSVTHIATILRAA